MIIFDAQDETGPIKTKQFTENIQKNNVNLLNQRGIFQLYMELIAYPPTLVLEQSNLNSLEEET